MRTTSSSSAAAVAAALRASPAAAAAETTFQPVLDFVRDPAAIDKVDRLDDVIMGGDSSSTVRRSVTTAAGEGNASCAARSGVCRTDGGGFCGFRAYPLEEPLQVGNSDGFYLRCRLASDDEPDRRVWKLSTRTRNDRGEGLYQAPFNVSSDSTTVTVPFSTFRYVRGPRVQADGPAFNASTGLYQLDMTMSKFVFGTNVTELEDFRDGFFELQIREIGVYSGETKAAVSDLKVLSKEESKKKSPVLLKVLRPIGKVFFSEQS